MRHHHRPIRLGLVAVSLGLAWSHAGAEISLNSTDITRGTTVEILDPALDIQAVIDGIVDADSSKPYQILLGPGVFDLGNSRVTLKPYVSLRGAGPAVTILTSSASAALPSADAATLDLPENSRVADLGVRNTGAGTFGIALWSADTSRASVVDNVVAEATGAGGTGHYAAYWSDAEAIIRNSTLKASGATGFGTAVNAAFGSVNVSDGFPQALIERSILLGGAASNKENCNDPTGTGFGLQLNSSSPMIRDSHICGGHRGIGVYTNGNPLIEGSLVMVSSTGSAFLFEISASGSISLANSGVSYFNKFTGSGTGLRCVHAYHWGSHTPASDGTTEATACN